MKLKKTITLSLCLLPLIIGIIIAIIFKLAGELIPVFQIRIDFASAAILIGAVFTALLGFYHYRNILSRKHIEQLQDIENNEHKQFLLRLDHELKNPLSAIKTSLASLAQLTNESKPKQVQEEMEKTIQQTHSQIERITRLVSDLRKLAELETYTLELQMVDIHNLLEQIVNTLSDNPDCKEKQVILSLPSTPWQLPEILTDEDLLYLCLTNLLDNAIKYTKAHDTIEIRAYENRDFITIEIADSGIGIPDAEIDQVWRKLYRAKNSRGVPGIGLGLSIVETIVRRLEGNCEIRSREGEGTVFTLQVPSRKTSK